MLGGRLRRGTLAAAPNELDTPTPRGLCCVVRVETHFISSYVYLRTLRIMYGQWMDACIQIRVPTYNILYVRVVAYTSIV